MPNLVGCGVMQVTANTTAKEIMTTREHILNLMAVTHLLDPVRGDGVLFGGGERVGDRFRSLSSLALQRVSKVWLAAGWLQN